jgi:hypothetical protein
MKWLEYKNTGVDIVDILDKLGQGATIDQIQKKYPNLSKEDILQALQLALKYIKQKVIFDKYLNITKENQLPVQNLKSDKVNHTNLSNSVWTDDISIELTNLLKIGAQPNEIARILRISEKIIKERIKCSKQEKEK